MSKVNMPYIILMCLLLIDCCFSDTIDTTDANIELCYIPSGYFWMGLSINDNNVLPEVLAFAESPRHIHYVDSYYISKYEISNKQFSNFIEASGYTTSDYWSTEGWQWIQANKINEPEYWASGLFNSGSPKLFPELAEYPIVGISFYEAEAYCNFIDARLPHIWEWEKAARGAGYGEEMFVYPWGNAFQADYCSMYYGKDVFESDYADNSMPVNYYTQDTSSYGLQSMSGNVEEWTNDWYIGGIYEIYAYGNYNVNIEKGYFKEVRGGSTFSPDYEFRISYRGYTQPTVRAPNIGFRVVFED